jgi:hypothetical protein
VFRSGSERLELAKAPDNPEMGAPFQRTKTWCKFLS